MTFKVGDEKPSNSGRKKGTRNKNTMKLLEGLESNSFDFVDEFLRVYEASDLDGKRAILLKSMDHIFPKLKAIEVKNEKDSLNLLTDEELSEKLRILEEHLSEGSN